MIEGDDHHEEDDSKREDAMVQLEVGVKISNQPTV